MQIQQKGNLRYILDDKRRSIAVSSDASNLEKFVKSYFLVLGIPQKVPMGAVNLIREYQMTGKDYDLSHNMSYENYLIVLYITDEQNKIYFSKGDLVVKLRHLDDNLKYNNDMTERANLEIQTRQKDENYKKIKNKFFKALNAF